VHSIRVMVTGAGSGVGQGIIKALKISDLPLRVISADIGPLNCGLFRTEEAVLIPRVESPGALEEIIDILTRNDVRVLMVGSEFDLEFFARNKAVIEEETSAFIVVSPEKTVEIAADKWATANFLKEHALPCAEAAIPSDLDEAIAAAEAWGYPVMLKARRGTSSRHVHVIESAERMRLVFQGVPQPMVQQLIRMPSADLGHEYTCSIFSCRDGQILGPFTARRTLRAGSSWAIEVAPFPDLFPLLMEIGRTLPSLGSLNVQLMVGPDGPVPFEFNARFSGTTAVRAHYGFNEPEMAIRSYVSMEENLSPSIGSGMALRYLEEVFVDGATSESLTQPLPKGTVRAWF
jgi:carbamoyl-phosphate synthase large subunit